MRETIENAISEHTAVLNLISSDANFTKSLIEAASVCINALRHGGKILFCGNGGSAADAQHLAAELSGRYLIDRDPLFAEALHVNSSYLTAVANDYDFAKIYERAILAKGKKGDVLIALSTSGKSENILLALQQAVKMELKVISLSGQNDKNMSKWSDVCIAAPSKSTPRIQEIHILFGHILCDLIEQNIFG